MIDAWKMVNKKLTSVYHNLERSIIAIVLCGTFIVCLSGCVVKIRNTLVGDVHDYGSEVKTKYKYYVVGNSDLSYTAWLDGRDYHGEMNGYHSYQPNTLRDDGIPIVVKCSHVPYDQQTHGMSFGRPVQLMSGICSLCSCGIIPILQSYEVNSFIDIYVLDDGDPIDSVLTANRCDCAFSLTLPTPLLCLKGDVQIEGFEDKRQFRVESNHNISNLFDPDEELLNTHNRFMAYAIASRLKELEDSGAINDNTLLRAEKARRERAHRRGGGSNKYTKGTVSKTKGVGESGYRLVKCAREKDSDFAYSFKLSFGMSNVSKEVYHKALQSVSMTIKKMYCDTYPNYESELLWIDFPFVATEGGDVVGRALVFYLKPTLLYDDVTHVGILSVRVNSDKISETKTWMRKNIEVLAQDKNVVVVSGMRPSPGKYRVLCERITEDNILELEFVTE